MSLSKAHKVNTFDQNNKTVAWRKPQAEVNERDCIECGELHTRNSAFCSFFCQVENKQAA